MKKLTKDWTELNSVLQAISESLDLLYKQRDDINDNITESERYQDRLLSKRAEQLIALSESNTR